MAENRHYAIPNPQWVDFPNNLPKGTKTCGMTRVKKPVQHQKGLEIFEFDVPARDGTPITLRSYRREETLGQKQPLLLYMHGGGFVTGSLDTDDKILKTVALETPFHILSIEYRLAPENPFPTGFEDCFDIVRWVTTKNAQQQLSINLEEGFVLGGTSAGANFSAGISHLAVQEGLSSSITGLVFLAASICHPDARPQKYLDRILSVDEINDSPGLTRKSIDYFAGKYGAPPTDKRLSPLLFPSHRRIARKAYFATCGWDPRRDEAILFRELLETSGIATKGHVYSGLPHGFWGSCPDLPVAKQWEVDLVDGLQWMLQ